MKVMFDTKIVVAAMIENHPSHAVSMAWMQKVINGNIEGYISTHSIAEIYAVLTRLPLPKAISPKQALNGMTNNLQYFTTIDLDSNDYRKVLETMSQLQITGGGIYDGLIARSDLKANVEILLTLNPKHFTRLGDPIASLVQEPSS
jgi:predicted nucleic acid-binding protein